MPTYYRWAHLGEGKGPLVKSLAEWWQTYKETRYYKRRRKERLDFIHALDEAIHKGKTNANR